MIIVQMSCYQMLKHMWLFNLLLTVWAAWAVRIGVNSGPVILNDLVVHPRCHHTFARKIGFYLQNLSYSRTIQNKKKNLTHVYRCLPMCGKSVGHIMDVAWLNLLSW